MNRLRILVALACVLALSLACSLAIAAATAPQVNFGAPDNAIELKPFLTPYHAPGGAAEPDGSAWYMVSVTNDQVRPAARVLIAGQPPRLALSPLPQPMRPAILAIASSDSGVLVQEADVYGHKAWRVIVPPVTSVGLAVRVAAGAAPPSLLAWTEPALSSHNRQLAIFTTAVATLIAAGAMITGGLAVLIGHAAPRWSALTLFLLLVSWLSGTGMFDASLATHIGGPYGLSALLTALALAAGARLADAIIPVREMFPRFERRFILMLYGLCGLAALAYLGVPAATLLTDLAIVAGSIAVAIYLVICGRKGVKAAQVIAPSATAFALVALAAAVSAAGGLGEGLTAPATTGGFAAAGAILLSLAVIASEEIAVLPFLHGSGAARLLEARAQRGEMGGADPAAPMASLALAAISAAHQGVFDLDFRAQLLTLSPDAAAMLGLGPHEATLSHADWYNRIHPDDRDAYRRAIEAHRGRTGDAFRVELRLKGPASDYRWLELRASIVTDHDVPSDCLGLIADIGERKNAAPAQDPLTGFGLKAQLDVALPAIPDATLAILDLDRFKQIHASLGDTGGDLVLLETAQRLSQHFGRKAQLFRIGGDGFALLFEGRPTSAEALANGLAALCKPPHSYNGRSIFAPASAGVAMGEGSPALLKQAELALLAAKRQGGGRGLVYHPGLDGDAPPDAVALEADLRQALAQGELELFYQPIVRLSDRKIAGFEALLRWRHPERGVISPIEFIAHSEQTGLIIALGQFALEQAARDLAEWQRRFSAPLFASVNFSRRQLRDHEFEALLARILGEARIAPGSLKLEVTESAVAADPELSVLLGRIKEMGAGLSIDDFGTGLSALSQLRNLPFDTVKIDKSFLARQPEGQGEEGDGDAGLVLSSIIALAHDLKRTVVVEGIESAAEADWLAKAGCEFGQGYHFSMPLTADEALDFIARHLA